jgi:hypothetical protein
MKNYVISLVILTFAIVSCNKSVDTNVLVNSNFLKNNRVIIDDTLVLKSIDTSKIFTSIVLLSGDHKVSVNDNAKESFTVGKSGGILNLDHSEYVIFPIKYSTDDILANAAFVVNLPIIIDTLIVYQKEMAPNQSEILNLLKSENSKDFFNKDLIKTGKEQLFINKDWDYGLDDDMPSTITTSDKNIINYKKKILPASIFLIYARISNEYNVEKIENEELISLINNSKKN